MTTTIDAGEQRRARGRARRTSCGSARQVAGTVPALDVAADLCYAVSALAFACQGPVSRQREEQALRCGTRACAPCHPPQRPSAFCIAASPLFSRLVTRTIQKAAEGAEGAGQDTQTGGQTELSQQGEGDLWERIHFLRHGRGEPPTFAHFVLALRKRTGHVSLVAVLLLDPFLRHYDLRSQQ